jgi:hypothetical protein
MRKSVRLVLAAALSAVALMLVGTASASAAAPFFLNNAAPASTVHCYTGYGSSTYKDLSSTLFAAGTFGGQTVFGCTPPFASDTLLGGDSNGLSSLDVYFTNSNKKACTTTWFLMNNSTPTHAGELIAGSTYNGGPLITVPAKTLTPTKFTVNFNVPEKLLLAGDQLMWQINTRTASGSCSNMTLYYGSASNPTNLSLPTLAG